MNSETKIFFTGIGTLILAMIIAIFLGIISMVLIEMAATATGVAVVLYTVAAWALRLALAIFLYYIFRLMTN